MTRRRSKFGDLFKKDRKKYGHPYIHLALVVLVVGLWLIPLDVLVSEVSEFEAKVSFLSTTIRATAEDLTVTIKSMGTFVVALVALGYAIYNHRKGP